MRKTMAKEVVHSVLDYFSLYMTFARLRNDLRTVEHFEDCWRLVFVQFFGSYRVPTPSPMVSCQSSADTAPRPRPRWFTEKYSRPVRKVVATTAERVAGLGRGEYFSVAYDVLECGHKKESTSALTGAPPAKHRRCDECGVQVVGAAVAVSGDHARQEISPVAGQQSKHLIAGRAMHLSPVQRMEAV